MSSSLAPYQGRGEVSPRPREALSRVFPRRAGFGPTDDAGEMPALSGKMRSRQALRFQAG